MFKKFVFTTASLLRFLPCGDQSLKFACCFLEQGTKWDVSTLYFWWVGQSANSLWPDLKTAKRPFAISRLWQLDKYRRITTAFDSFWPDLGFLRWARQKDWNSFYSFSAWRSALRDSAANKSTIALVVSMDKALNVMSLLLSGWTCSKQMVVWLETE